MKKGNINTESDKPTSMRKTLIIILAMLFVGILIVIFTIVIGFDENPSREIPDDTNDPPEVPEGFGRNAEIHDIPDRLFSIEQGQSRIITFA